jgi:hypothetical protein
MLRFRIEEPIDRFVERDPAAGLEHPREFGNGSPLGGDIGEDRARCHDVD